MKNIESPCSRCGKKESGIIDYDDVCLCFFCWLGKNKIMGYSDYNGKKPVYRKDISDEHKEALK